MKRLSHATVNKAILSCCYIPIVRRRPFVIGLNAIHVKGVHRIISISACVRAFVDWLAEVFDNAPGMVRATPPLVEPPAWPVLDAQRLHEVDAASQ
jgi:LysR family transcriptional regulator, regulator for bpeEF and oprC